MKPITKQEAKQFDRTSFHDTRNQELMDRAIELLNDEIKLNWEDLEKQKPIFCDTNIHWDKTNISTRIKELYEQEGYELIFSPQLPIVSIRLIN